jgi:hypothetical protein
MLFRYTGSEAVKAGSKHINDKLIMNKNILFALRLIISSFSKGLKKKNLVSGWFAN